MKEYVAIKNFSGGAGRLLVTKKPVTIKKGDQYIAQGFSGDNVFTWNSEEPKKTVCIKVIAVSLDFDKWKLSGNNNLQNLPKIDFN